MELVWLQRAPGGLLLQEVLVGQVERATEPDVASDVVPALITYVPAEPQATISIGGAKLLAMFCMRETRTIVCIAAVPTK